VPGAWDVWTHEATDERGEKPSTVLGYLALLPYLLPWTVCFIGGIISARRGVLLAVFLAVLPLVIMSFYKDRKERYMFPATALLVVAFVAWLGRGAPRPRVVTMVAAVVPVLLLLPLPLGRLLNVSITSDTFGLIPLLRLSNFFSGGEPLVKKLVIAGGIVGSLVPALVPRRLAAPVLLSAVAVFFILVSYAVHGSLRDYSRAIATSTGTLSDPTWVDDRVGDKDVSVFFGNSPDPFQEAVALWEAEFLEQAPETRLHARLRGARLVSGDKNRGKGRTANRRRYCARAANPVHAG
jgi:hypothetical protein